MKRLVAIGVLFFSLATWAYAAGYVTSVGPVGFGNDVCGFGGTASTTIIGPCPTGDGGGGAEQTIAWSPGLTTTVGTTFSGFTKFVKASTVDNFVVSASILNTCSPNPTIEMDECGTSTTCASPTTIASVTVTATGTATPATISSSAITAGDYVAFRPTAGTCVGADFVGMSQVHAN